MRFTLTIIALAAGALFTAYGGYAQDKKSAEKLFEHRRISKKVASETFLPLSRSACVDGIELYVINYGTAAEDKAPS